MLMKKLTAEQRIELVHVSLMRNKEFALFAGLFMDSPPKGVSPFISVGLSEASTVIFLSSREVVFFLAAPQPTSNVIRNKERNLWIIQVKVSALGYQI